MALRLTVDSLISDVRSLLDEDNEAYLTDEEDILPALNRAQDVAANILARHYETPLLTYKSVTLASGQQQYEIPEDAFEQRLEAVELNVNGTFYPLKRIDFKDISVYENPSSATNLPYYYCVIGGEYRLLPNPTSTYPLRIWYLRDPEQLVTQQGRITLINSGSNYVNVDEVGSSLSTDITSLNSFVNFIDGTTGKVKGSAQIQNIAGNRITFKSSPNRDSVRGKDIAGSLPTDLEKDDYVCVVLGSCIPVFKKPFSNYLIQYAVADLQKKLGGDTSAEMAIKKELEQLVERSWVGRANDRRVKRVSQNWSLPRRFYPTQG